jgi:hypothetical protein
MLQRANTYYETYLDKHADADDARLKAQLALKTIDERLTKLMPRPRVPQGAVLVLTFDKATYIEKGGKIYVRDLSGQNNHALLHGATPTKGIAGEALAFDGEGQSADIANNPSLQITGNKTISLWLFPTQFSARRNPFNKAYGGEGTITIEKGGTISYFYGQGGGNAQPYVVVGTREPLELDKWNHLVMVRDFTAKKVTLYRNGHKVAEAPTEYPAASASTAPIRLGAGYAGAFAGKIDEVAVFNRALTEKEVLQLYDMGQRGYGLSGR